MMEWAEPLFNFGGLGVAVLVLVVFGRQMFERISEASRFSEELSKNAISSMQGVARESAEATRSQTEALTRLCLAIEELRSEVREGHNALLREVQGRRNV